MQTGRTNTRATPVRDLIERKGAAIRIADAPILGGTIEFMQDQTLYVDHIFYWLSGKGDDYRIIGGQARPWSHPSQIGPSYGFGSERDHQPDWRKQTGTPTRSEGLVLRECPYGIGIVYLDQFTT